MHRASYFSFVKKEVGFGSDAPAGSTEDAEGETAEVDDGVATRVTPADAGPDLVEMGNALTKVCEEPLRLCDVETDDHATPLCVKSVADGKIIRFRSLMPFHSDALLRRYTIQQRRMERARGGAGKQRGGRRKGGSPTSPMKTDWGEQGSTVYGYASTQKSGMLQTWPSRDVLVSCTLVVWCIRVL